MEYSVIVFDRHVHHAVVDDTTSSAEDLLTSILRYAPGFGTNFTSAIEAARVRMDTQWDNDRFIAAYTPSLHPRIILLILRL